MWPGAASAQLVPCTPGQEHPQALGHPSITSSTPGSGVPRCAAATKEQGWAPPRCDRAVFPLQCLPNCLLIKHGGTVHFLSNTNIKRLRFYGPLEGCLLPPAPELAKTGPHPRVTPYPNPTDIPTMPQGCFPGRRHRVWVLETQPQVFCSQPRPLAELPAVAPAGQRQGEERQEWGEEL